MSSVVGANHVSQTISKKIIQTVIEHHTTTYLSPVRYTIPPVDDDVVH